MLVFVSCAKPILHRHREPLQRPQQQQSASRDYRRPEDDVQPQGWREQIFNETCETDDAEAEDENAEHSRTVTRVVAGKAKTADVANFANGQKSVKEPSPSAAWTSPAQSGPQEA